MNRRDFAKTGLGGLLASLALLLLPGKAKAEPKFPRYFGPLNDCRVWLCMFGRAKFVRADTPVEIVRVFQDGTELPKMIALPILEQHRLIREITAAEADALLKPKRIKAWWSDG